VDVSELVRVLRFEEKTPRVLLPAAAGNGERVYQTWADEFVLSVISLKQGQLYESVSERSMEIMFCTEGELSLISGKTGSRTVLVKGQSVMIPAGLSVYHMEGRGTVYKAGVPADRDISAV
jgi:mannose-6-phosphate isomerase